MKPFVFSIVTLLFLSASLWNTKTYQCSVLEGSSLEVIGHTNVKGFTCEYSGLQVCEDIQIDVTRSNNTYSFQNCGIEINTCNFDCGRNGINKDFQDLLKADDYPTLKISLSEVKPIDDDSVSVTTAITITNVTLNYTYKLQYNTHENVVEVRGILPINITDFKLHPPTKFMGMVKVKEQIELDVDLRIHFN